MARFQRFLAIPMGATVVAALWLLYRQTGTAGLLAGIVAALLLALILAGVGWRQRKSGRAWPIALAGAVAAGAVGLTLLPSATSAVARAPQGAERWSPDAVRSAQAAGKPVFVYFTADWCLTCKANEAAAIDREETRRAFREAGVEVLVGDWTNGDPAIGRFLESRGRAGVPLYLWYAPGQAQPEELPQILTPSMLIERARASR
jgi:thiol:disulfide interchange protein